MRSWGLGICLFICAGFAWSGTIKGLVKTESGAAPGVVVTIADSGGNTAGSAVTNNSGRFFIGNLAAGTYSVKFFLTGLLPHEETDVEVSESGVANLAVTMRSEPNVMESLTVSSASRRTERIVDAPAAISVITAEEIDAHGGGQIPKILESTPGVELAQNGVFDFNINARGFNSSLNRRVLVLIDGRDPATGFLGNQEWSTMPFPMASLESIEFVRGPGSALYGANAFNGVLNMRTRRPADDLGGRVEVTAGNLSTKRLEFKYAGIINNTWSYRVAAGASETEDWAVDRVNGVDGPPFEYAGLESNGEVHGVYEAFTGDPSNPVTTIADGQKQRYYSARVDGEFGGHLLTLEGGFASTEMGPAVTGLGRVRIDKSERPYFRLNYNTEHWNFKSSYTTRETPEGQTSLSSGTLLWEDSSNLDFELQGNYDLMDGRLQLVGGVSYREQDVDTGNRQGFQTLMVAPRKEDQTGVFGQLKFAVTEKLDLVAAGRWDDSSLHEDVESPKAAVVYKINDNHSVRATYGRAFQTPNYSEYYLRAAAGVIPFGQVQDAVSAAFGLDLRAAGILDWQDGFAVAVGNEDLVVEEITSYEIGYKGVIGQGLYVTVDYYESELVNFVTDLLPGVNSNINPYQLPEGVPAVFGQTLLGTLQSILGPLYRGLTNSDVRYNPIPGGPADGNPVVTLSYANTGAVDTQGLDVAFNYYINDSWVINGNYSWFDFDVIDPGLEGSIVPNSAETKYNLGLTFNHGNLRTALNYHYVDGYPYAAGVFTGAVPEYDTVGLNLSYTFNLNWRVDLTGSNIFDEEHYELMGGSLNGARFFGVLKYTF